MVVNFEALWVLRDYIDVTKRSFAKMYIISSITYLAHMIDTVISVNSAVLSGVPFGACAGVVAVVISTHSSVFTRVEFLRAERDFFLAEFAWNKK